MIYNNPVTETPWRGPEGLRFFLLKGPWLEYGCKAS
jgi:hypothetical protein